MSVYIASKSCISSQNTFEDMERSKTVKTPQNRLFECIEPDCKDFFTDTGAGRRMNRLQKFCLRTAADSLEKSGKQPDAIIFATGWGCIESSYKFLERLFDGNNLPVNPAVFIQSTHNAPAAQTAIYLKSNVYNNVIVDDRLPFELALDNALLCLNEDDCSDALIVAGDEITPQLVDILRKISKSENPPILGEGCASFVLTKDKKTALAEIPHFSSFNICDFNIRDYEEFIKNLCSDFSVDYIFAQTDENLPENIPRVLYPEFFGTFPTCAACGLWLAVDAICGENKYINHAKNILLISKNKYGIVYACIVGKP